nr:MAG TPA: hypothetical protein [Caudoviricetes sp.]
MIKAENGHTIVDGDSYVVLVEFAGAARSVFSLLSKQYPAEMVKDTMSRITEHSMQAEGDFDYDSSSLNVAIDVLKLCGQEDADADR